MIRRNTNQKQIVYETIKDELKKFRAILPQRN